MKQIKKLKKELGERYLFCRFLSDKEILRLQRTNPAEFEPQTVSSLTVGCVKIECCIYMANDGLQLGCNLFVKDNPDSADWIFYDSPSDTVGTRETDLFPILDRIVSGNGLSYTECCFEKLDGKIIKIGKKQKKDLL